MGKRSRIPLKIPSVKGVSLSSTSYRSRHAASNLKIFCLLFLGKKVENATEIYKNILFD